MTTRREGLRLRTAPHGAGDSNRVSAVDVGGALRLGLTCARAPAASSPPAEAECEGEACPQVTVTLDEQRRRYRARNNSADRWVRVTASNLAASACLAPGREDYLALKSIVDPYRAEYAAERCGSRPVGH